VHEYLNVDLEVLARAVESATTDYREYVAAVAQWLRRRVGGAPA
jgi:uncharacterized protein YutE (UPF0331/DUF86 family)